MTNVTIPRNRLRTIVIMTGLLGASLPSALPGQYLSCPPCGDGNQCTDDTCDTTTGTCRHDPRNCDDHNPCTQDVCYRDPRVSATGCEHLPLPAGTLCEDGNPCTIDESCDIKSRCLGQPQPEGTQCDDRNPCTVQDACDSAGTCVGAALSPGMPCDDSNLCTSGDTCEESPAGGVVCAGLLKDCDDGDACTVDLCVPTTGECGSHGLNCDDGNQCTQDTCDPLTGCVRTNRTGSCDDGNICTTGDFCQDGNCVPGQGCPPESECAFWRCDLRLGCTQVPILDQICHLGSLCQAGICTRIGCQIQIVQDCNDGNPCTSDSCDPATGTCSHSLVNAACSDGNACTIGDICQNGQCVGGTAALDCNDGNPCTADSCDPASGCLHLPSDGLSCEDGDACTSGDTCQNGACRGGIARSCGDGNPCTVDSCDPAGGCLNIKVADGTTCDDGNVCTYAEICLGGVCGGGSPIGCDDGNPCTVDSCDPLHGCVHAVDPYLPDSDGDKVPDACDNCPTIANPNQDRSACQQSVVDILLRPLEGQGRVVKLLTWRTTHEVDVVGYSVVTLEIDGTRTPLNREIIPCAECTTGAGAWYAYRLRGRQRREALYVELIHQDGRAELFGPATTP